MSDEPWIPPPRMRRFTLLDAMVLIAATAGALRFCHQAMIAYDADFAVPMYVIRNAWQKGVFSAPVHICFWFQIAAPFLLAWSLALTLLRFFPPRPDRSELSRQPGAVAALSITGALAALVIGWVAICLPLIGWGRLVALGAKQPSINILMFRMLLFAGMGAGQAVAGGWLVLALTGRWKPAQDWIDRAGRVVGALAILSTPFLMWASLIYR